MSVFKPIDGFNVLVTPFYAYKKWNLNALDSSSAYPYSDSNTVSASLFDGVYYRDEFITASLEPTTEHGKLKRSIWNSINHMFYNNFYSDPYGKWIQGDITTETRKIYDHIRVISVPTKYNGEGIKRGSFRLSIVGTDFIDDSHGNIIVEDSSSYFVPTKDIIQYDFNDAFRVTNLTCSKYTISEESKYHINAVANNVVFTASLYPMTGQSAIFDADLTSSIRTSHHDKLHFTVNHDYSVVTNISLPNTQKDTQFDTNIILTKNGKVRRDLLVYGNDGDTITYDNHSNKYPFAIEVYNQTSANNLKIRGSLSDGNITVSVTSSAAINSDSATGVALVKSGSNLMLYIDGVLNNTATIPSSVTDIGNDSMFFMGTRGDNKYKLTGTINYVLIYDTPVSITDINLILGAYKIRYPQIGNIFYKQGLAVLTSPRNPNAENVVYSSSFSLVGGDNNYHVYMGSYLSDNTVNSPSPGDIANSDAYPVYATDIQTMNSDVNGYSFITGYYNIPNVANSASINELANPGLEVSRVVSASSILLARYSKYGGTLDWIKCISGSKNSGNNIRASKVVLNPNSDCTNSATPMFLLSGKAMVTTSFFEFSGPTVVTASFADNLGWIMRCTSNVPHYQTHICFGNGGGFDDVDALDMCYYSSSTTNSEGLYAAISSDSNLNIPMSASTHRSYIAGILVNYDPMLIMRSESITGQPNGYDWPQQISGVSSPKVKLYAVGTAENSDAVYVVGRNRTNATTPAATAGGLMDDVNKYVVFTAKYNRSGSLQWMVQSNDETNTVGGGGDRKSYQYMRAAITVDPSGDCYVVANRTGSVGFTGSISTPITKQTSANGRDIFVHKYDTNGTLKWVEQYSGSGGSSTFGEVSSIKMGVSGCFYMSGVIAADTASLPKYGGGVYELRKNPAEFGIGFVVKCTGSNGSVLWVNRIPCYIDSTYFGTNLRSPSISVNQITDLGEVVNIVSNYSGSGASTDVATSLVTWIPYPWDVEYKSTKKITQYEVLCTVGSDELNATQNPTIVDETDTKRIIAKPFVTGSDFSPYVTTIGLYNDLGDLLAVGKLAKPVKRNRVSDTTYVVRFDLF